MAKDFFTSSACRGRSSSSADIAGKDWGTVPKIIRRCSRRMSGVAGRGVRVSGVGGRFSGGGAAAVARKVHTRPAPTRNPTVNHGLLAVYHHRPRDARRQAVHSRDAHYGVRCARISGVGNVGRQSRRVSTRPLIKHFSTHSRTLDGSPAETFSAQSSDASVSRFTRRSRLSPRPRAAPCPT